MRECSQALLGSQFKNYDGTVLADANEMMGPYKDKYDIVMEFIKRS